MGSLKNIILAGLGLCTLAMLLLPLTSCQSQEPVPCDISEMDGNTTAEEENTMVSKDVPEGRPPIDLEVPDNLETATFGLG